MYIVRKLEIQNIINGNHSILFSSLPLLRTRGHENDTQI
jgi:hypothetical protein